MPGQDWIDIIKNKFKQFPRLYYFIVWVLGPVLATGKSYKSLLELVPVNELIVNLGSGPGKLSDRVLNIDLHKYKNVDILADVHSLPFKDNSVGGVINIAMMEHIDNSQLVINEIYRILKPGGSVYTVTPFIFGFHASPDDYYRWTKEGVKKLLARFDEMDTGIFIGPTSALSAILQEWLSLLFSFQNKYLYYILSILFMIVLAPFKIFDLYLSRHPEASRISACFYHIAKKPGK